jgi:hypothetical protein
MPSFSFVDEMTFESFVTICHVPSLGESVKLPRVQRGKRCQYLDVSNVRPTTTYTVAPCQNGQTGVWKPLHHTHLPPTLTNTSFTLLQAWVTRSLGTATQYRQLGARTTQACSRLHSYEIDVAKHRVPRHTDDYRQSEFSRPPQAGKQGRKSRSNGPKDHQYDVADLPGISVREIIWTEVFDGCGGH